MKALIFFILLSFSTNLLAIDSENSLRHLIKDWPAVAGKSMPSHKYGAGIISRKDRWRIYQEWKSLFERVDRASKQIQKTCPGAEAQEWNELTRMLSERISQYEEICLQEQVLDNCKVDQQSRSEAEKSFLEAAALSEHCIESSVDTREVVQEKFSGSLSLPVSYKSFYGITPGFEGLAKVIKTSGKSKEGASSELELSLQSSNYYSKTLLESWLVQALGRVNYEGLNLLADLSTQRRSGYWNVESFEKKNIDKHSVFGAANVFFGPFAVESAYRFSFLNSNPAIYNAQLHDGTLGFALNRSGGFKRSLAVNLVSSTPVDSSTFPGWQSLSVFMRMQGPLRSGGAGSLDLGLEERRESSFSSVNLFPILKVYLEPSKVPGFSWESEQVLGSFYPMYLIPSLSFTIAPQTTEWTPLSQVIEAVPKLRWIWESFELASSFTFRYEDHNRGLSNKRKNWMGVLSNEWKTFLGVENKWFVTLNLDYSQYVVIQSADNDEQYWVPENNFTHWLAGARIGYEF